MKLGIHAYAWTSEWSNETLDLIDRVKSMGMDFIEIPLMRIDKFDPEAVRARLEKVGLGAVTSTALLPGLDITSDDKSEREKGAQYLVDCVRATAAIGADSFSGVIHSVHARPISSRPTEEMWKRSAEALQRAAEIAEPLGVTLGIEPVNRYESFLVNTCEQALKLAAMTGMDNVRVHLDTYHMNIEEKSFREATKLAGDRLVHYHLCENDRGIPGTGLVDWDGVFRALSEIGYGGYAALESFVDITDNMNTWVWRQLAPDGDTLLSEGAAFIRKMQEKYGLV
ncbi:MAG: sugar phosphate isomerase/epimerase family protein [Planctomycetota bacterium]|jgi:D-psicose/D-tagatose/L-ribulose 3-epimerase